MKKRILASLILAVLLMTLTANVFAGYSPAPIVEEFVKGINKDMELYPNWIVNGETQPIFNYGDAILEIVYVEVPCDTDRDNLRDRVSVYIMRPKTAEGFLCPVMLEHSPYHNGTVGWSRVSGTAFNNYDYMREPFRYKDVWPISVDLGNPAYNDTTNLTYDDIAYKGIEAYEWPWDNDGAFTTGSWYTGSAYGNVPPATVSAVDASGNTIYEPAPSRASFISSSSFYRYYLPRGYALVYGQLLGNLDCDGITNTLHIEEVLSAMAVIKWLNGEAKGFTSRRGNVETKAGWANGNVGMTGTSYPADISFATVVTGVEGLKAVMPQCNGLNWYDYYRYAGTLNSPGGYGGEDLNLHASYNFSRFNADVTSGVPPADGLWFGKTIQDAFFETQKHMMDKTDRLTGDYNTEWELRNFARNADKINEDVGLLMTTGFMDWNSQPKLSMANFTVLLDKLNGTFKEIATISSHSSQASAVLHGKSVIEWWHLWMDHFLLGLDNNVVESIPDLTVINTKTGAVEGYWINPDAKPGDPDYLERGGIVPGAQNQTIYMLPAKDGKAGRLSYNVPAAEVDHFSDMDVLDMLQATYPGSPTLTASQKTINRSSDGNYRVTTGSGTSSQSQFCEGRAVGINRTYNFGITGSTPADIQAINQQIFTAVDKPIEGRLMYLSEPLEEDVRLSGTGVVYLQAAPSKGMGNLSAAVVEVGRVRNMESSRADAWSMSTTSSNRLLDPVSYNVPYGGGISGNLAIGTFRNPSEVGTYMNYKYVTVGYADVQNPNYSGKVWFEVPEQNYIPDFYFQTTKIVPGKYYPYTIELDPYDYVFKAGSQIGVMVFGSDPDYSPLFAADQITSFDIAIGPKSYTVLPLMLNEPKDAVTIEASSIDDTRNGNVARGDEADITYSINDNSYGFKSLELDMPFKSSVYAPVDVTPSALLNGATLAYTAVGDVLKVSIDSDKNIVGDGTLFTVTYEVNEKAPYGFSNPLEINVVSAKFDSFMDKLVDVEVETVPGVLVTAFAPITSIRIEAPAAMTVLRGNSYDFAAILNTGATDAFLEWSINNKAYATVNNSGIVSVLNKTGTAVLTVKDPLGGMSYSIILRIV